MRERAARGSRVVLPEALGERSDEPIDLLSFTGEPKSAVGQEVPKTTLNVHALEANRPDVVVADQIPVLLVASTSLAKVIPENSGVKGRHVHAKEVRYVAGGRCQEVRGREVIQSLLKPLLIDDVEGNAKRLLNDGRVVNGSVS